MARRSAGDEGCAEHDEPLNVAQRRRKMVLHPIEPVQDADGKVRTLIALVYRNGIRRRPLGGFDLDVIQNDWCQDHSRYSHESLADD